MQQRPQQDFAIHCTPPSRHKTDLPLGSRSLSDEDLDKDLVCHCIATVAGHDAGISSMVSAGELLYTASLGNKICVWEQPDIVQCDRFGVGSMDTMCSVRALLAVGDVVFAAHQDHKIRAWQRRAIVGAKPTHRLVATLPSRKECFLKSLSQKNYVQVRRHHKKLWIEHTDTISALALGEAQSLLYSASWDKTVKVWRLSDLKCVESIRAHDDAINAMVVCEQAGTCFLYTGSADGKVKVWRKSPGAKKHVLLTTLEGGHEKGASINSLVVGEGGDLLFSGGSDGAVTIWGRRKGEKHISMLVCKAAACHTLPILSLCTIANQPVPGGFLLLSGSADKTVRIWQIRSSVGREGSYQLSSAGVLQGHLGPVKTICAHAPNKGLQLIVGGGCLVYTGSTDKSIKSWWLYSRRVSPALHD